MTARVRLEAELKELENENSDCFDVGPSEHDLYSWSSTLVGPVGSPYEGGKFVLKIDFPFIAKR